MTPDDALPTLRAVRREIPPAGRSSRVWRVSSLESRPLPATAARGPSDQPDADVIPVVRPGGSTLRVRLLERSFWPRVLILIGLLVAGFLGLLALEPIPQSPNYHRFADTRSLLGIPNFNDVASNAGFAVVGILGVGWSLEKGAARSLPSPPTPGPISRFSSLSRWSA